MNQGGKDETRKTLDSVAALYQDENGLIQWMAIEKVLEGEGLDIENDPRIRNIRSKILQMTSARCITDVHLSLPELKQAVENEEYLITQALLLSLTIRDYGSFVAQLRMLYDTVQEIDLGEIKDVGELYPATGNEWNVSVVSVDGQKTSIGEKVAFPLDEFCGPLIHGLAIDLCGEDAVNGLQHEAAAKTPPDQTATGSQSSWFLKDIAMILTCALIKSTKIENWTDPMKHDYVLSYFKGLCCGEILRFSNATYSEIKNVDFKSISLAYFLKAFSKSESLHPHFDEGLDLLFQLKSMEVTTDSLAMIGAVLANGGISPFDKQEILSAKSVTGLLNAMYSGGFGNSSVVFAVEGGVPGISSDSGAVLIVIPGVLGMGMYSPRVQSSCSVRAYNFITELIKMNEFHPYRGLERQVYLNVSGKIKKSVPLDHDPLWPVFFSVAENDQEALTRSINEGLEVANLRDHSGLSLLHIAAANGHIGMVKLIFCKAPELLFMKDSRCWKPSDYAKMTEKQEVIDYLSQLEHMTRTSMIANSL